MAYKVVTDIFYYLCPSVHILFFLQRYLVKMKRVLEESQRELGVLERVCELMYIYTYVYICMHMCMYMFMYIYVYMCMYMYVCGYIGIVNPTNIIWIYVIDVVINLCE